MVLQRAWAISRKCHRDYKYLIRASKKSSWRDTTTKVDDEASMAKLVRNLTRPKDKSLGLIKRPDGIEADGPDEVGNILMDAFFPDSTNVQGWTSSRYTKSSFHYSAHKGSHQRE